MRVHGRVEIPCTDEAAAERLLASVRVDDGTYASTRREGDIVIVEAEADSIGSLRHTLEDWLAAVSAFEGAESVSD